jgi:peptide/nickel transport system substrate-binding protein
VVSGGTYAHGGYPDIDGLFREQAAETERARREATLQRIQELIHEKVMFAPIWLLAGLSGRRPRVEESGIGVIPG